jgi:hypothetical protein
MPSELLTIHGLPEAVCVSHDPNRDELIHNWIAICCFVFVAVLFLWPFCLLFTGREISHGILDDFLQSFT